VFLTILFEIIILTIVISGVKLIAYQRLKLKEKFLHYRGEYNQIGQMIKAEGERMAVYE